MRWVLGCLRAVARGEPPPAADPSVDWSRVLETIEAESLGPAIAHACKKAGAGQVPGVVLQRLRHDALEATARHLVLTGELGRLLTSFRRGHIPVMPLKGPTLAELLYPDPTVRPCCDLDLLIRREDLERTDELLRELGYRRLADAHSFGFDVAYDHATLYAASSGVRVDLHWSLLSEPRYAWDENAAQAIWDRAMSVPVAGQEARVLGPEDLLLYLSTHLAVHHAIAGVLWHYDLFLLVERWRDTLDWGRVAARARTWRVRTAAYFALSSVERLFEARVPVSVLRALEPRGGRAAATRWILAHRSAAQRRSAEHLIGLLLVDRGRDVLGAMRNIVFPRSTWIAARYDAVGRSRVRQYAAHYRRLADVVGQATSGLRPRRR